MLQEFKVKPMFEDQFHERHQFILNIEEHKGLKRFYYQQYKALVERRVQAH